MLNTPRPGLARRSAKSSLVLSLLLASTAAFGQAQVNDLSVFELDANAHDQAPAGPDWEQVAPNGTAAGALADTFIIDSVTGDDRIFMGGGSKDVRDISAWGSAVGEPPDKNDIEHAFAAAFDVGGDLVVYFGLDRFSTDGDSAMGFWFFKNAISVTATGFSGVHAVGDILVTSDNVNGGAVSEINVFEWVGGKNPLQLIASSKSGGTTVNGIFCLTNGYACAVRNSSAQPVPASWGGYTFKGAGAVDDFPQFAFYEGGINVSRLLGTTDRPCFASFMAMTRTSASETAQLKDFAVGAFPLCGISVTKTCAGSGVIAAGGDSIDYTYTAAVTNTGAGTVYGVGLAESSALPGDFSTTCKIDGTSVTTGQVVEVFASLAPGATDSVDITCNSRSGSLSNSIVASAKTSAGATESDLSASDDSDQCSANISPGMEVTKSCVTSDENAPTGVTLVAGGFQVCVDIDVANTSVEKLVNVHVVDAKFSNPVLVDNGSIDPGQTLQLHNKCYTVTAADGDEDTPGLAAFTNGVQAEAFGALSGQQVGDADPESAFEATTTCKLCECTGDSCTP